MSHRGMSRPDSEPARQDDARRTSPMPKRPIALEDVLRFQLAGDTQISPDGRRIAFLYRRTPADRTEEAKKEREEKEFSSPVRVHRKLFYRLDGFGYFDESFWQIHVVDVSSGKDTQLTNEPRNLGRPAW